MTDPDPAFVSLGDRTAVGAARRRASALADAAGFDDAAVGRLAVVVTELTSNVISHAGTGELFARRLDGDGGVEVTVVDRGPGIADLDRAMEDGFSTAGSAGTGLGAVRRMSDAFHVHSVPGAGTVASALVRLSGGGDDGGDGPPAGALVRPHPHEDRSGDAWSVRREGSVSVLAMVDGLGHGPRAGDAAEAAIRSFHSGEWDGPETSMERIHGALRHTRGAVGAVLELDAPARRVRFVGVGNVAASLVAGGEKRSLVSMNGTLGGEARRIRAYEYPCPPGSVAVLHTDGISARWGADRLKGVVGRPPALICGVLYMTQYRNRDDAAVAVLGGARPGRDGGPEAGA